MPQLLTLREAQPGTPSTAVVLDTMGAVMMVQDMLRHIAVARQTAADTSVGGATAISSVHMASKPRQQGRPDTAVQAIREAHDEYKRPGSGGRSTRVAFRAVRRGDLAWLGHVA
jgi:hypothetical protein